jgi:hypothetical protein
MNRRVSVWKYVRIGKKWRYCNFSIHRYEGGKEIWKKVGRYAQEAVSAADVESTYRYIGSKQKLQDAVNDRLGISVASNSA